VKDASGMMCDASVAIHWEVSSGYLSGMLDSLKWLTTRRRMFSLLSLNCCIPIELDEKVKTSFGVSLQKMGVHG
jgi:hypothetical protein